PGLPALGQTELRFDPGDRSSLRRTSRTRCDARCFRAAGGETIPMVFLPWAGVLQRRSLRNFRDAFRLARGKDFPVAPILTNYCQGLDIAKSAFRFFHV